MGKYLDNGLFGNVQKGVPLTVLNIIGGSLPSLPGTDIDYNSQYGSGGCSLLKRMPLDVILWEKRFNTPPLLFHRYKEIPC